MDDQTVSRVHYFERQFLRTQDFSDEQSYHLAMRRRHNLSHHTWGIVSGLELDLDIDCNPIVRPGFAVDGYGRELVWATQEPLPVLDFDARGSDTLNVWLAYNQVQSDVAPQGYAGCGDSTPDGTFYRIEEQPVLVLTIPNPSFPDPRAPEWVPDGDLDFDATRTPPDDPRSFWPVYLGQVARSRSKPSAPYQYSVNLAGRPYAGLIGEAVYHPEGNAWVEIGTSPTGQDIRRFAVFLTDPPKSSQTQTSLPVQQLTSAPAADDTGDQDPRLEITSDGQMNVRGDATLNGNLTLEAGRLIFQDEAAASSLAPTAPRPWALYRVSTSTPQEDGAGQVVKDNQGNTVFDITHDLRVEISSQVSKTNELVIGAWRKGADGKEAFQPCLTVDDKCNVTVSGNLIVQGYITPQPNPGTQPLSPQAQSFIMGAYSATAQANVGQVAQLFAGQFGVDLDALGHMLDSGTGRTALISFIASEPNRLRTFCESLIANQDGRDAVIAAFIAHSAELQVFVDRVVADSTGQTTLSASLLHNNAALVAVLTNLWSDPNGHNTITSEILSTPAGRQSMAQALVRTAGGPDDAVAALLGVTNGPTAITTGLLAAPTTGLQPVLDGVLQDPNGPHTVAARLLQSTVGLPVVLGDLVASPVGQNAVANALLANTAQYLTPVLTPIVADPTGQSRAITGVLQATGGVGAIATELAANPGGPQAMITALDQNQTAAAAFMDQLLASTSLLGILEQELDTGAPTYTRIHTLATALQTLSPNALNELKNAL